MDDKPLSKRQKTALRSTLDPESTHSHPSVDGGNPLLPSRSLSGALSSISILQPGTAILGPVSNVLPQSCTQPLLSLSDGPGPCTSHQSEATWQSDLAARQDTEFLQEVPGKKFPVSFTQHHSDSQIVQGILSGTQHSFCKDKPFLLSTATINERSILSPVSLGLDREWRQFLLVEHDDFGPDAHEEMSSYSHPPDQASVYFDSVHPSVPEESSTSTSSPTEPLYFNSTLSEEEGLLAILSYASSVNLSGTDFCKLLELLNLLLPQPNKLPSSKFNAFKIFENNSSKLDITFYCNKCWKVRNSPQNKCDKCEKSSVKYFVTCSIEQQLQKLYARPGFAEKIKYKHNRKKDHADNIEDVYDSEIYREAQQVLREQDVTLTWYSDGIAIFVCSAYSLWVFILIINELPPEDRFKPENIIIAGLWGDDAKPHPNVFLLPLYHDIKKVSVGFSVKFHGSEEELEAKALLLFGECDLPAKAMFMNIKSHSGYFSCTKCLIKGEKSNRTNQTMVFPYEEGLVLRSDVTYQECVNQSVLDLQPCNGVFGPTILSYMTHSNFIKSVSIDSMHCVFMGIVKQILKLLFDVKFRDEPFSLYKHVDEVNARLQAMDLPHFVERLFEDVTKLAFWKATLCRNFLLYFILVVLRGIMLPQYYDNLLLLVSAVADLNKSSISESDIIEADLKLNSFVKGFEQLYGIRHMSMNIHLCLHLARTVIETGNLCYTSCFRFEDLNGKLCALVHGTVHATKQIFKNFSVLSELPSLVDKLDNEVVKSYCNRVLNVRYVRISTPLADGIYLVGDLDTINQERQALEQLLIALHPSQKVEFRTFSRLYKDRCVYVSASYPREGSRNSSFSKYSSEAGFSHGQIKTFVQTTVNGEKLFYALILKFDELPLDLYRYVLFSEGTGSMELVPVVNLKCVSFYLKVGADCYLVDPLNNFELE